MKLMFDGRPVFTGMGPGRTDYSDKEVVIGTWIDGKPLYRKITTGLTVPTNNNTVNYPSGIEDAIDTVLVCYANTMYGPEGNPNWISSNYQSSGGSFLCGIYINSRELWISNTLVGPRGKLCFAITEYTKQKD